MIEKKMGLLGHGMSYPTDSHTTVCVFGHNLRYHYMIADYQSDFERGYIWASGSDTVDISSINHIDEFMKAVGQWIADNEIIGFDASKPVYSCPTVNQFLLDRGMGRIQAEAFCYRAQQFLANSDEFIRWPSMPFCD